MKTWQKALVSPDATIESAISALDEGALRIALIVDSDRRLLGTLTDGDVRRALLRRVPLTHSVADIMCSTPKVAQPGWSRAQILAAMDAGQVIHLPVVDDQGRVLALETLDSILQAPRRDNPVFLMAGGFGKRLQPMTQSIPKPLLKVGKKPLLELILEGFVAAGFHRFFISLHYMPEMIRDHFGDGSRWGVTIQYIQEDAPLGTGGALGLLPPNEIDAPVIVMNGDLLTAVNYGGLLDFHAAHTGTVTVCVCRYEHQVPYGVIVSEEHQVMSIEEKPSQAWFVNAGIYVLAPELVRRVPKGCRVDMPDLISAEIASGRGVNAFPLHEYWLDIGRMDEFEKAQSDVETLFRG